MRVPNQRNLPGVEGSIFKGKEAGEAGEEGEGGVAGKEGNGGEEGEGGDGGEEGEGGEEGKDGEGKEAAQGGSFVPGSAVFSVVSFEASLPSFFPLAISSVELSGEATSSGSFFVSEKRSLEDDIKEDDKSIVPVRFSGDGF